MSDGHIPTCASGQCMSLMFEANTSFQSFSSGNSYYFVNVIALMHTQSTFSIIRSLLLFIDIVNVVDAFRVNSFEACCVNHSLP